MGELIVTLFLGGEVWLSLDAAWVREVVSLVRAASACAG